MKQKLYINNRKFKYLYRCAAIVLGATFLFNTSCSERGLWGISHGSNNTFVVDINAKHSTKTNPVSIELNSGRYNIKVIGVEDGGAYNAWKPWFYKEKKNDDGSWKIGWVNKYSYNSTEFAEVTSADNTIYETPELALGNARNGSFTLKNKAIVNFYIADSPHIDNAGGISLLIAPASASVE